MVFRIIAPFAPIVDFSPRDLCSLKSLNSFLIEKYHIPNKQGKW